MVKLLIIAAVLQILLAIFGPILKIMPFSWLGLINSFISAILFIAVAVILSNQEDILDRIDRQEEKIRKILSHEKKVCKKCNYSYDLDYKSCPNCCNIEM